MDSIVERLDTRRRELGLSCKALALHAGLSHRTVQRVLAGHEADPGIQTIRAITAVLGMSVRLGASIDFAIDDLESVLRRQAEQKASRMIAMLQGTAGLEAQALDQEDAAALKKSTVLSLLRGSPRKLWAE